jgi:ATP-dependent helicase/nuclease subunit A
VGVGEVNVEDGQLSEMTVQPIVESSSIRETSCIADFVVNWQGQSGGGVYFDEELISPEKQWVVDLGVAFHAVMEHVVRLSIKQVSDMPSEEALSAWLHIDQDLVGPARVCAMNVLRSEQAAPFFFNVDIQSSWEELDIAADDGRLLRIDRLIELPNRLVILDYKLSIPSEDEQLYEKYCLQMSVYRQAVRRLRTDKPVESYLLSANGDVLALN